MHALLQWSSSYILLKLYCLFVALRRLDFRNSSRRWRWSTASLPTPVSLQCSTGVHNVVISYRILGGFPLGAVGALFARTMCTPTRVRPILKSPGREL